MRQSFHASSRDLIDHGEGEWQIERSAKAFSMTDHVLTIKGTQDHEAVVKNTSTVSDGQLYIVTLDITSIERGKVRVQLGNAEGEWRTEAGLYSEHIISQGKEVKIVADPNCKAVLNLGRMSVRRK